MHLQASPTETSPNDCSSSFSAFIVLGIYKFDSTRYPAIKQSRHCKVFISIQQHFVNQPQQQQKLMEWAFFNIPFIQKGIVIVHK